MKTFYEWLELKLEEEQEQIENAPKVLWITGMNSTGSSPKRLAAIGYEVKHVGTTTNRYAAYLGRFKRYSILKSIIGRSADKLGQQHINANVKKHALEMKQGDAFVPDIVVGSSQGGAIVMQIAYKYPQAKFVLAAPAWKIFGATYKYLPKDTIILHGTKDLIVPMADSQELESLGFKVRYFKNIGHSIPLTYVQFAIEHHLNKLGIPIPKPPSLFSGENSFSV